MPIFLVVLAASAAGQGHKLNAPLPLTPDVGNAFRLAVDASGTTVVYSGDLEPGGVVELWSARADFSGPPVKLSGALVAGGGVFNPIPFRLAGTRVVYAADALQDELVELFSAPLDASAAPVRLSAGQAISDFQVSADGQWVVYRTATELFSVPSDGSLSASELMDGSGLAREVHLSPDSATVVARFDASWLFKSQSIDGSGAVLPLATPVDYFDSRSTFSADGQRFFFAIPSGYFPVNYLRSVPVDASAADVLITSFVTAYGGDWEVFSDGARVLVGGDSSLKIHSATGGVLATLATLPSDFVSWVALTPDETWALIGYSPSSGGSLVARVPIDGSQALTTVAGPWNAPRKPRFTSDGAYAVLSDTNGLYSLDTSWSQPRLTLSTNINVNEAAFHLLADDERVVFSINALVDSEVKQELHLAHVDGSPATQRLDSTTGQGIEGFAVAEASEHVAYLDRDGGLFSPPTNVRAYGVPLDLGAPPATYHGPLPSGQPTLGEVTDFRASADGDVVVYRADQDENERFELFAVTLFDPRGPRRLNPPLGTSEDVATQFLLSADGELAAFWVTRVGFHELWSARTDGSTPAVQLDTRSVLPSSMLFSGDGTRLVYALGDFRAASVPSDGSAPATLAGPANLQVTGLGYDLASGRVFLHGLEAGVERLHSMPIDASVPAIQLVPTGAATLDIDAPLVADGLVYFLSDPVNGTFELHSVPIDGSAAPLIQSGPLVAGGRVTGFIVRDGVVIYRADSTVDERFELYRVSSPGVSVPLTPMSSFGDVEGDFALTPGGGRVVYRADPVVNARQDLFSVPSDGSAAPTTLVSSSSSSVDVQHFTLSAGGGTVVYGRQGSVALPAVDLWRVPTTGGSIALVQSRVRTYLTTKDDHIVYSTVPVSGLRQLRARPLAGGPFEVLGSWYDSVDVTALEATRRGRVFWLGSGDELLVDELYLSFTTRARRPSR